MEASKLAFSGPLRAPEFLEPSTERTPPEGERSQGSSRLASLALAGGMLLTSLGWASASEWRPVVRTGSSQRTPISVDGHQDTATQDLLQEWQAYLENLRKNDDVAPEIASAVRAFWSQLTADVGREPDLPYAGPTEQASFILVWDQGRHHFEVEIRKADAIEWFYRDRRAETFEAGTGALEEAVSAARDYLHRLRAA